MTKNLLTAQDCIARYGKPETESHMYLWDVPTELELGVIPKRLYCNADMVKPLITAFSNIINRKLIGELKTFDGYFNIRTKRGGSSPALRSWGVAIDRTGNWIVISSMKTAMQRVKEAAKAQAEKDGMEFKEFTFHDLKRKGISDTPSGDRQASAGHRSADMMKVYDVLPDVVQSTK